MRRSRLRPRSYRCRKAQGNLAAAQIGEDVHVPGQACIVFRDLRIHPHCLGGERLRSALREGRRGLPIVEHRVRRREMPRTLGDVLVRVEPIG